MNKQNLTYGLIFGGGALTGAVITWFYAKKKYEFIIDTEIESARNTYNLMAKKLADKNESIKKENDVNQIINSYAGLSDDDDKKDRVQYAWKPVDDSEEAIVELNPIQPATNGEKGAHYIIAPEEFGNVDGYDLITLTYYPKDKIVTDDLDEPLDPEHVEEIIGSDSLNSFGEYDDYTVYVRNDDRKCDYEILLAEDESFVHRNE